MNSLIVISDGSVVVTFIRISVAAVPKGESAPGIELDRHVEIGDGSVVVAFVRIDDASVPKGVSARGSSWIATVKSAMARS